MKLTLCWSVVIIFLLSLFTYFKHETPSYVLTAQEKLRHFEELAVKKVVFLGKEGKRPFIITCGDKVHNGKGWVKYK
jgi:hypothetical protein